jgi:hypothetical protein
MGRYYCGDISGKFWFTIQSSLDADHFGGESFHPYMFVVCGCEVDDKNIQNTQNIYCKDCFSSFDEHCFEYTKNNEDEIEEDESLRQEGSSVKLFQKNESERVYRFTAENDWVKAKSVLLGLENKYGHYIKKYELTEYDNSFTYDIDMSDYKDIDDREPDGFCKLENIARICLGRQIVGCLEKRGVCRFFAEL